MGFAQHISKLLGSFWQKLGSRIQLLKDMESLVNPTSSWLISKECHHRHPFCHRLYLLLPENNIRNGLRKRSQKDFLKVKRIQKKSFQRRFHSINLCSLCPEKINAFGQVWTSLKKVISLKNIRYSADKKVTKCIISFFCTKIVLNKCDTSRDLTFFRLICKNHHAALD